MAEASASSSSKRSVPRGQRATQAPHSTHRRSVIGLPARENRLMSMPMGQLKAHIPHCTQRPGSATTRPRASRRIRSRSDGSF